MMVFNYFQWLFAIWTERIQSPLSSWKDRIWEYNDTSVVYANRFHFIYRLNGFLSLKMTRIPYDKPCRVWKRCKIESLLTADADLFECVLQMPIPFFSSL